MDLWLGVLSACTHEHSIYHSIIFNHRFIVSPRLASPSPSQSFHFNCITFTAVAVAETLQKTTGWWFEPLWKIWKSVGMMNVPQYIYIWKNKKCSKPPTRQGISWWHGFSRYPEISHRLPEIQNQALFSTGGVWHAGIGLEAGLQPFGLSQ